MSLWSFSAILTILPPSMLSRLFGERLSFFASGVLSLIFPRLPSEVVEKFPALRNTITSKLKSVLPEIKSGKVFRGILWILGEYVHNLADIESVVCEIGNVVGEIPILASEEKVLDDFSQEKTEENGLKEKSSTGGRPKVLADGTYATESPYPVTAVAQLETVKTTVKPPLRALLLAGDFFTGTVLATALTKLVLRYTRQSKVTDAANALQAQV